MYGFLIKLMYSFEPLKKTDSSNKTLTYYVICLVQINCISVMFYSRGPKFVLYKSINCLLVNFPIGILINYQPHSNKDMFSYRNI
jgi:hypothetical protein